MTMLPEKSMSPITEPTGTNPLYDETESFLQALVGYNLRLIQQRKRANAQAKPAPRKAAATRPRP
jgi:hypothetical protein